MGISKKQILTTAVQIKSSDIYKTRNIDGLILHKLKKYETKCMKYGYIIADKTELISRSVGKVRNIDNKSYIEYDISYKIESILPSVGSIYKCIVGNITKMGLICYIEYGDFKDIKSSPLLIIIPKEHCDIEKQKEGRNIKAETLDTRIKYMGSQIQIVCKIVD